MGFLPKSQQPTHVPGTMAVCPCGGRIVMHPQHGFFHVGHCTLQQNKWKSNIFEVDKR